MKRRWTSYVLGCGLLLLAATAEAATYYVATTGDDASPGTISAPFRTIAKGVSVMRPGDALYIRAGTYAESVDTNYMNIPSGAAGIPTVISAYQNEVVTVHGGVGVGNRSYVTFNGLVVDGQGVRGTVGINASSHITVSNCEIKNSIYDGIQFSYSLGSLPSFVTIDRCRIHDNGNPETLTPAQHHGIYVIGTNSTFTNNVIYNNSGSGIQQYDAGQGLDNNVYANNILYDNNTWSTHGLYNLQLGAGDNTLAYNNVIYNTNAEQYASNCLGVRFISPTNTKVYNNTISGCDVGVEVGSDSSHATIKNNIIYQASTNIWDSGTSTILSTNLTTDPKFIDTASNNFHLQPSSLAINTGLSLPEVPCDFNGNARPAGGAYDIGAYEYGAAPGGGCAGGGPTPTRGDLTGDGTRDLADVRLLIYMLLGQQPKTPEADLTGDGAVTLADVQALIRLMVGLP